MFVLQRTSRIGQGMSLSGRVFAYHAQDPSMAKQNRTSRTDIFHMRNRENYVCFIFQEAEINVEY
jgi:hypothetical protein